jgi:hypothetical protein
VSPKDARRLIRSSAASGRAVIGIDAVELTDTQTQPRHDLIADFSGHEADTWDDYVTSCHAAARRFLRRLPPDDRLYVTLTFLSRDEWEAPPSAD